MVRQAILWTKFKVKPLHILSAGLNAKLFDQSTEQISTPHPTSDHYAPHQWTRPNYSSTKQLETPLDTYADAKKNLYGNTSFIS